MYTSSAKSINNKAENMLIRVIRSIKYKLDLVFIGIIIVLFILL